MPGLSRVYVATSVPTMAANLAGFPSPPASGFTSSARRLRWELYSTAPSRCCSSVTETLKSKLKSLPSEDAQGNAHPIRRLYACSLASGARDTAESVTSWFARWTTKPSNPSAIAEHDVVDEELRAPSEEVCQRGAPVVGLKSIFLVDPNPRQLLPLPSQLVAAP